jgi:hypothetical protein
MAMRQIESKVHRDLPATRMWGFGLSSPGPTFETRSNQGLIVQWVNELPRRHFLPIVRKSSPVTDIPRSHITKHQSRDSGKTRATEKMVIAYCRSLSLLVSILSLYLYYVADAEQVLAVHCQQLAGAVRSCMRTCPPRMLGYWERRGRLPARGCSGVGSEGRSARRLLQQWPSHRQGFWPAPVCYFVTGQISAVTDTLAYSVDLPAMRRGTEIYYCFTSDKEL